MSDGKQWITAEVELPQEVLDAHAEGRVVFFVGAGASYSAPSSLPLFEELATILGAEAGVPYSKPRDGAAEPLDRFLGQLTHLTPPYAVHERALAALTPGTSMPNAWHDAIVRLAAAHGHPRIVTTNFDDHLDNAALAAGITLRDKWIGPALPLGHSVTGLVHLHGSVTRGHKELVLTDKDLGQAYLSEAWATRFLLKLFQENVVLFIGYGLTDPTMRYLTLGLPSGASLYAFTSTSESTNPDWARLGVTTIAFGEDFDNVPKALKAWDIRARMGQLDHRARVEALVLAGTILSPVDRDYLAARVSTPDGARDFLRATGKLPSDAKVAWLLWAESQPAFQELFAPREISEAAKVLGTWFLREFVGSPDLHGAAFQTFLRLGPTLSSPLFRMARAMAWGLDRKDPIVAERWRAFLATSVPGESALLDSAWMLRHPPHATAPSVTILRAVLRPYLKLEPRLFISDSDTSTSLPNAEVTWTAEQGALTSQLLRAVAEAPEGDRRLGAVLEEALASAYDLLRSYYGERTWDPLSHGRSSIEPHAQDSIREPLDAIVDALREYGAKALGARPELPDRWWDLEHPLFQRLALHLVTKDASRSSDDKLQWLLRRSGPYAIDLKHELFQLIAASLPETSANLRSQLLAATLEGPELPDELEDRDGHASYAKYNLLVWLTRSAPDWTEAAEAMALAQEENPTFEPREHPDFDMWMWSGEWGGKLPVAPEEFVALLSDSAAAALDSLLARDYTERRFEDPTWEDALTLVSQIAGTRPELSLDLWTEIENRGDLDGKATDLRQALVNGWGGAELSEQGERAVACAATMANDPESAHAISHFLLEQMKRQAESDESATLSAMRKLAQRLWDSQSAQFTHGHDDPLSGSLSLNSWPGYLAQYWLQEIDRRWRHNRENWTGLSDEESTALVGLLSGPRAALDATQPVIAGALQFIFAADEDFAVGYVLPLFMGAESAAFAWHSYLYSPRWNDRILAAGLLAAMNEQWERLDQLGDRGHRAQFFGLVAAVLSWAGIDEESRHTLLTQSVLGANGAHAVGFAEMVVRFLADDGVDGAQIWSRWLRAHLTERLEGVPRVASPEELTQWANTVPHLGDAIPDAADLLRGRGIGLDEDWFILDISAGTLRSYGSTLVDHFAERLANTAPRSVALTQEVRELVNWFRRELGDHQAQPLVEAARDGGFLDGEW